MRFVAGIGCFISFGKVKHYNKFVFLWAFKNQKKSDQKFRPFRNLFVCHSFFKVNNKGKIDFLSFY